MKKIQQQRTAPTVLLPRVGPTIITM